MDEMPWWEYFPGLLEVAGLYHQKEGGGGGGTYFSANMYSSSQTWQMYAESEDLAGNRTDSVPQTCTDAMWLRVRTAGHEVLAHISC